MNNFAANQIQPIFECVACQRQFATQAALMNHVERKHPEQGEIKPEHLNLGLVPIDQMLPKKGQPIRNQQRNPAQQQERVQHSAQQMHPLERNAQ